MSYMVCHFGKYKSGNVFGLQKHNQRENENYSNSDPTTGKYGDKIKGNRHNRTGWYDCRTRHQGIAERRRHVFGDAESFDKTEYLSGCRTSDSQ